MSFDRRWLEDSGSEDSHGRTLWALGECARSDASPSRRRWAAAPVRRSAAGGRELSLAARLGLHAARAWTPIARPFRRDSYASSLRQPARRPADVHPGVGGDAGLGLVRGRACLRQRAAAAGADRHRALRPATRLCRGRAAIVALADDAADGAGGLLPARRYRRASANKRTPPQPFDQQPLEATATISACLAAWRADGDAEWRADAARAFAGFSVATICRCRWSMWRPGSCRDGLHPDRANENRGGESVVSYLLGLAEIRRAVRACGNAAMKPQAVRDLALRCRRTTPTDALRGALSQLTFLNRQALYLRPDPARVVVRPFKPATEPRDFNPTDKTRANHIVDRVLALDPEAAASQLADVLENFQGRHRNLLATFEARADEMEERLCDACGFTKVQRQLIGAYFLHEYSFEAAALFNPSIVAHPDQSGAPAGGMRFILSLRAVGEGHVSSLTFRSGSIAADGSVTIDPTARLAAIPKVHRRTPGARRRDRRGDFQAGAAHQRAGDLSRSPRPSRMASRMPASWSSRTADEDLLCHVHRL